MQFNWLDELSDDITLESTQQRWVGLNKDLTKVNMTTSQTRQFVSLVGMMALETIYLHVIFTNRT